MTSVKISRTSYWFSFHTALKEEEELLYGEYSDTDQQHKAHNDTALLHVTKGWWTGGPQIVSWAVGSGGHDYELSLS